MTASASAGARVVVVGVGNPWRGDDGAGPAVATAVHRRLDHLDHLDDERRGASRENGERRAGHEGNGVEVLVLDGEPARLVDAWDGADLAVVVDAVRTGARPGTLHRLDVAGHHDGGTAGSTRLDGLAHQGASSHGLGVAQAVELGRVLGRLPSRLVVIGIEGADFGPGNDLTAGVAAAVEPAARLVAELIGPDYPVVDAGIRHLPPGNRGRLRPVRRRTEEAG